MPKAETLEFIKQSFTLKEQGFYKPAIVMLYKALDIDPDNIEILAQLAQIYKLLGEEDRTTQYIEKVLEIDNNHIDSLKLLLEIYEGKIGLVRGNANFQEKNAALPSIMCTFEVRNYETHIPFPSNKMKQPSIRPTSSRARTIATVTVWGAVANLVLSVLKMVAGLVGHSAAMTADAVHSLSDLMSDVVVLVMVRVAGRERDDGHDYGHGKFETLATLAVSLLLLVVGGKLMAGAVDRIRYVIDGGTLAAPEIMTFSSPPRNPGPYIFVSP